MIIDPDMPTHWKTRMLGDLLEQGKPVAVYCLVCLWGHCQSRKKWIFDRLPPVAMKAICEFDGDADTLDSALIECGFITRDGNQVTVVGWEEHNSNLVNAWENGKKGGRPPKPTGNPPDNQQETHGKPTGNPRVNLDQTGGLPDKGDKGDKGDKEKPIGPSAGASSPDYTPGFEQAWKSYPKRSGGNPKKAAFKAWNARLKQGATEDEMAEGVARYAKFCKATGKLDTEFVKQAATFFGPDEHFREAWDTPPTDPPPVSAEREAQKREFERQMRGAV